MPIFLDALEKGRTTRIYSKQDRLATDWLRDKAQEVKHVNPNSFIKAHTDLNRAKIRPGSLYLFNYDPKTKEDLPYYDRFPIVFPFKGDTEGFLGMNLHYLPPVYRAKLMDALYPLVTNQKYDDTTRIKASYALLNSSSKYKYFVPCIKRYLYSHVKSKFLLVPANEWDTAMFLPLQRFVKKGDNYVYSESRKIINGL